MEPHVDVTQTLKEGSVQTHLGRRGSRYYLRRRIPLDLVAHFGRKEIWKALETADRREAERRVRAMSAELDEEFARARMKLGRREQEPVVPTTADGKPLARPHDLTAFAARILSRLIDLREKSAGEDKLEEFLQSQRSQLEWDREALAGKADLFHPLWHHEALMRARQELLEPGKHVSLPPPPQAQREPSTAQPESSSDVRLMDLVKYWIDDRRPSAQKTMDLGGRVASLFVQSQGDLPVAKVTKPQCVAFREGLRKSGQSVQNTNKLMGMLNTLFTVAESRGIIERSPASRLAIADKQAAKEKKLPFDDAALTAIFSGEVYSERSRPKAGAGEAAYWLPILAMYTGARVNELGQLWSDDVLEETFVTERNERESSWVIRITTNEERGQRLKNSGSERRIPVHRDLIRLGFLDYVRRQPNKSKLFPALVPDRFGNVTGNWTKWFSRYLRNDCSVKNPKMTFHSFRHKFKDLCREVGISLDTHDALTGHTSGSAVSNAYGGKYPLLPLVNAMDKFRIPAEVMRLLLPV